MSEVEQMPLEIWTDINGNATRTQFKGGVKYIRADERDRLRCALERISTEHCTYKTDCNSPYDIGVVDGHRCAATIARAALTPAGGGSNG